MDGNGDIQGRRFRHALMLVGLAVALIAAVLLSRPAQLEEARHSVPEVGASSYAVRVWDKVKSGVGASEAISSIGFETFGPTSAPAWMDEILDVRMLNSAIATEDMSLVGFSPTGSLADVERTLDDGLLARGWARCDSGQEGLATYVKEGGECTWLMTECTEADGDVSVVLHIERT